MLRPNSRSCRTASIRSGIAGGLAGELKQRRERSTNPHALRGRNYRRGSFLGQLTISKIARRRAGGL